MSIEGELRLDRKALRPRSLYLLYIAAHALRTELEQKLRPLGITGVHYSILAMIESNGGMSSTEVARRFFVTPQTMNETIIAMERQNLLKRHKDPSNARSRIIRLTSHGAETLATCESLNDDVEESAFACLEDAELAMLRRLTDRVFTARLKRD